MSRILFITSFIISLLNVFFLPISQAKNVRDAAEKKCHVVEAEKMQKNYEDNLVHYDNMLLFDIRSDAGTEKVKNIPLAMGISYKTIDNDALYEIEVWNGKDIYLVGEDTKSTETFCKAMLKKNYPIGDIYILKGGINEWKGPLTGKFKDVQCEIISQQELLKAMNSGDYAGSVDLRSHDDYMKGHLPLSIDEGLFNQDKENLCLTKLFSKAIRKKRIVAFIGYTDGRTTQRCRSIKWAVGHDKMYVLEGNMNNWKGPLETGEKTVSQVMSEHKI